MESDNALDFEMGNHFMATHPQSMLRHRLVLRALTPEGRVTVMNREATIWRDRQAQKFQLADRRALRALLQQYFGFDLPEVERLRVPAVPEWS